MLEKYLQMFAKLRTEEGREMEHRDSGSEDGRQLIFKLRKEEEKNR
jgi:hypothetical protein